MSRLLPVLVLTLLIPSYALVAIADNGRSADVDLDVSGISITYPDSANQSLYQMFSSNYPIPGFNKPEMLYVTDGVVGVELNINIVVENLGTAQSGFIDVEVMKEMNLTQNDFSICPEITTKLNRLGYEIIEIPVRYNGRNYSDGKKIRFKDALIAFYTLIKFRFFWKQINKK